MTIEVGIIVSIGTLAIGTAAYIGGRYANIRKEGKTEGEFRGELRANLTHIQNGIDDLKLKVDKNAENTEKSIRRLHTRLDDHLRHEHNMGIPVNRSFGE